MSKFHAGYDSDAKRRCLPCRGIFLFDCVFFLLGIKLPACVLGIMRSQTECEVAKNILNQEDFYVAEHLSVKRKVTVIENDKEKQVEKIQSLLKTGDIVAVYRLSDEKYLILDKVVSIDVSI